MEVCCRREGNFPCALTVTASHLSSAGGCNGTTLYLECFPLKESLGNGLVCMFKDSTKCRSRDVHHSSCMFVLVAIEVGKPQSFEFIQ
jgi:hypothetical protein